MKYLILLMFSAWICYGQNVAVRFCGEKNAEGLPSYWPAAVAPCGVKKSVDGYNAVMTWDNLSELIATNRAAFAAAEAGRVRVDEQIVSETLQQAKAVIERAKLTLTVCSNVTAILTSGKLTQVQLDASVKALGDALREQVTVLSAVGKTEDVKIMITK